DPDAESHVAQRVELVVRVRRLAAGNGIGWWDPDPQGGWAHGRLSFGEEIGELTGELVRPIAAHRVAGDGRPVRVEVVVRGGVGPHLEDVGTCLVVVPAVRTAPLGRD